MATVDLNDINRHTWNQASRYYARLDELLVPEQVILRRLAADLEGRAVLDLGVGAGRTTPHLRALKISRYIGGDFAPSMVAAARRRYPDAEFLELDACDLSRFAHASFALVLFSYNGIDYVTHERRLRVLAEVHRVLEPGGAFVFSSHNLAWHTARNGRRPAGFIELPPFEPTLNPVKLARRTARFTVSLAQRATNRARLGRLEQMGDEYAIVNDSGENYACLTYYTTIAGQRQQLERAGFEQVAAYGLAGLPAPDDSHDYWIHYVSHKAR
jgi:SAM-dependent methyltransferase